jgi:hypothetical protein
MPFKPTLFITTDIETTMKRRIAFDIAWKVHDRKNREYARGSYVIREAFKHDVPFFAEKLGHYFDDAYSQLIKPANILDVKLEFNRQVTYFQNAGHRVIACAYNSAFDFKYLPETVSILTGGQVTKWMDTKIDLMDIWDFWGSSVPLNYTAQPTASGKYFSTSAESAYRWEFNKKEFIERHIAWSDVEIESEILCRALSRKKKMPIVSRPSELAGAIWKKINTRIGIDGKKNLIAA